MKKTMFLAAVLAGFAAPLLADTTTVAAPTLAPASIPVVSVPTNGVLADENARFSYAYGLRLGGNLKQSGFDLDDTMFLRGIKDAQTTNAIPLLNTQELNEVLNQLTKKMQAKQMALRAEQAAKNKAAGEAFLATNKNNPGVITLPSGLQYKVLTDGDGPIPAATNSVKVNYRGTLVDGTEFDSSAKAGHPLSIAVNGVIKGWTEALQLMKVGSKWQLYVPSSLAYGERGYHGIAPNSALIFDIELLEILPPKTPAAAPARGAPSAPLTSDIIKVPSAEELKKGAQIEYIKPEDVQKAQAAAAQTNPVIPVKN
jgi:FKBP-type peptidyl-prolyl cis-trans isomerase